VIVQGDETSGRRVEHRILGGRCDLAGCTAQSLPDAGAGEVQEQALMADREVHFLRHHIKNGVF
jgi:hypothetical protein